MQEQRVRIVVDAEACQGHTMCSIVAPTVFDHDENGTSIVKVPVASGAAAALARRAAETCPERAISIHVVKADASDGTVAEARGE